MNFTINTTPMPDGTIAQEVISDCGLNGMKETLFRRVIQTQDAEIEKALIAMGWTPPGKTAEIVAKAGEVMRERCRDAVAMHDAFGVIVDRREEAGMTIRALPGVTLEDIK